MSSSPFEPSNYDPSVHSIEDRVAIYDPESNASEDEDDEDMDYEPASEDLSAEDLTDEDDQSGDYHDASEDMSSGVEYTFEIEEETETTEDPDEDEEEDTETEQPEQQDRRPAHPISVSRAQLMQLMGRGGLRRLLAAHGLLVQMDDSDEDQHGFWSRRTRRTKSPPKLEPVPNPVGQDLLWRGTFGNNIRPEDRMIRKKKLAYNLMRREMGLGSYGAQKAISGAMKHEMVPCSTADMIIHYNARCYSGQFSNDGNFFFSCGQDFNVRMYDTSNPYHWKYYKVVENPYGRWTITDASLSLDNRFLAYSSISRIVCLASTDPSDDSDPRVLDFSRLSGDQQPSRRPYQHFGIWSIRFSGDGREIVAGTGDRSVYVFDIERNESILRIPGHHDDVNAVCFGDTASPHILYSGSDDTTLKVWDRRSLGDGRAAGVFLGHTEGLTYVDSKGDGRYIISNGKDQTAKLWDLRKVISTEEAEKIDINRYTTGFEYRMDTYDVRSWLPHPHDCSLVTFRGHSVLKTLIRCHFSPPGSTDARYVYSGSHDGAVYVWNLDATLAGKIDVAKATRHLRQRERDTFEEGFFGSSGYHTCVRDASWHPDAPVLAATSWNGWGTSLGTCTVHTWNDGLEVDEAKPAMGRRVNEVLIPEQVERDDDDDDDYYDRRKNGINLAEVNAALE